MLLRPERPTYTSPGQATMNMQAGGQIFIVACHVLGLLNINIFHQPTVGKLWENYPFCSFFSQKFIFILTFLFITQLYKLLKDSCWICIWSLFNLLIVFIWHGIGLND